METWQITMFVIGGLFLAMYFKRRSDRLSSGE